jgi:hypothetical protein
MTVMGGMTAVGGIAVFEAGASFFALMRACSIGHPTDSQTNVIDPPRIPKMILIRHRGYTPPKCPPRI